MVLFQILLDGAEPRDVGTTWLSSPLCWRGTNRILLASALLASERAKTLTQLYHPHRPQIPHKHSQLSLPVYI